MKKDLKSEKLRRVKELENSIQMYNASIQEMVQRGQCEQWIDLVMSEAEKERRLLEFIKSMNDEQFEIYYDNPYDRVKKFLPDTVSEFSFYKDLFSKLELNNCKPERAIFKKNGNHYLDDVIEPLRKNGYLVTLPDFYNIAENEVVEFWDDKKKKEVHLRVRESAGKRQIIKIYNILYSKHSDNGKAPETIYVNIVTPNLQTDYVHVYNNCELVDFFEDALTYKVDKDEDSFKYFSLTFSYNGESFIYDGNHISL